jgi:hypothetical protein
MHTKNTNKIRKTPNGKRNRVAILLFNINIANIEESKDSRTWSAIMFAHKRRDKVSGRTTLLITSIQNKGPANIKGLP